MRRSLWMTAGVLLGLFVCPAPEVLDKGESLPAVPPYGDWSRLYFGMSPDEVHVILGHPASDWVLVSIRSTTICEDFGESGTVVYMYAPGMSGLVGWKHGGERYESEGFHFLDPSTPVCTAVPELDPAK